MQLSRSDLHTLCNIAVEAALKAGSIVAEYTGKNLKIESKEGGSSLASQVITEVDLLSQEQILATIRPTCSKYDLALLTEESVDDHSRFVKDYFWCIDPLDGTLPFTEGTAGYAVSIALVSKEGVPQIGVVYDPLTENLYHAIKGVGALRNQEPWKNTPVDKDKPLTFITDRSFLKQPLFEKTKSGLEHIADHLEYKGLKIIHQGGAAMNACWTLENGPACYLKYPKKQDGGGSLWDYAATACIFEAAGGIVSDIYGQALELNRKDSTFMNHRGILYSTDLQLAQGIQKLFVTISQSEQ